MSSGIGVVTEDSFQEVTGNFFDMWMKKLETANDGINPFDAYWEWIEAKEFPYYRIPADSCKQLGAHLHDLSYQIPRCTAVFALSYAEYTRSFAVQLMQSGTNGSDVTIRWGERRR